LKEEERTGKIVTTRAEWHLRARSRLCLVKSTG
jgi:hypothetical protein